MATEPRSRTEAFNDAFDALNALGVSGRLIWERGRGSGQRLSSANGDRALARHLQEQGEPASQEAVRQWRVRHRPNWAGSLKRRDYIDGELPLGHYLLEARLFCRDVLDEDEGGAYATQLGVYAAHASGHSIQDIARVLGITMFDAIKLYEAFPKIAANLEQVRAVMDRVIEEAERVERKEAF